MRRAIALGLILAAAGVFTTVVVVAAGRPAGFDGMVHAVEVRYHVQATRIPFMGFASAISNVATHGGVGHVQIATFEDFKQDVNGNELAGMAEANLGPGWTRMIRETHNPGREQTLIYSRPDGNKMEMLVVDLDSKEMDIVSVAINPKYLSRFMDEHSHAGREGKSTDVEYSTSENEAANKMQ